MAMLSHRQAGVLQFSGSFTMAAAGPAVTAGKGFTVAYAATGRYTITLKNPIPAGKELICTGVALQRPSGDSTYAAGAIGVCVKSAPTPGGVGVIIMQAYDKDGAFAAGADTSELHFQLELRTSSEVV